MSTSANISIFQKTGLFACLIAIGISAATMALADPASNSYPRCYQDRVTISSSSAEIPTPIKKPKTIIPLGCERPFIYRGETYSADSPQAQDGATLREFVKSVPEADAMMKDYQDNRSKSKLSAYTGTAGILIALLAGPISNQFNGDSRASVRSALQIGGIALAAGGFFYSFTLLRTNEYLIPKAVDRYNKSKPEDPIELKFATGWSF